MFSRTIANVCIGLFLAIASVQTASATELTLRLTPAGDGGRNLAAAEVRFPKPGRYLIELASRGFEPFILVYRGNRVVRQSRGSKGAARLTLQIRRGPATLTIVATHAGKASTGRARLRLTPTVQARTVSSRNRLVALATSVQNILQPKTAARPRKPAPGFKQSQAPTLKRAAPKRDYKAAPPKFTPYSLEQRREAERAAPEPRPKAAARRAPSSDNGDGAGSVPIARLETMPPNGQSDGPPGDPVPAAGPNGGGISGSPPIDGAGDQPLPWETPVAGNGASPPSPDADIEPKRKPLLPPFTPWPPPRPSAQLRIPTLFYGALLPSEGSTLGDVADLIEVALGSGGYGSFGYFSVPGGFALATQLEQIEEDGSPVAGSARWNAAITGLQSFDLSGYIRRLFLARVGYYRVIVFILRADPVVTSGETLAEDPQWVLTGASGLPDQMRSLPFEDRHDLTALIYEFEKRDADDMPVFHDPGRLQASDHLAGAQFIGYINRSQEDLDD